VVVGKYVPQLQFFEVLLGEAPGLQPEANFYQRLLAHDQDQASELAEEYLQTHDVATVYEELFMPAMVLARADRDRGELDAEELHYVVQATRDIAEDLPAPKEVEATGGVRGKLVACPARDAVDEACLVLLAHLLRPAGFEVEILSADLLGAEKLEPIARDAGPVVCIGSLAPGGLAEARYLCKRIRASNAAPAVVVARFGEPAEALERVSKRLADTGATKVVTTLAQALAAIVPLLQVAAARPEPTAEPALA
jgi:hypothetical protein